MSLVGGIRLNCVVSMKKCYVSVVLACIVSYIQGILAKELIIAKIVYLQGYLAIKELFSSKELYPRVFGQ